MEKKDILENGMLELYLLGELSASEEEAVRQVLAEDEELSQRYRDMERDLEIVAKENAIAPSGLVKERLLRRLEIESPGSHKTVELSSRRNPLMYTAIAASIAAAFFLSSLWLYQKMKVLRSNIELVDNDRQQLETAKDSLSEQLQRITGELAIIKDADTEKYIMRGNRLMPQAVAVGYVNRREGRVILDRSGLPDLPQGKSYQLWGDVDGKMIDMGVIPDHTSMASMNYLPGATSLNITIEPEGGSQEPTVSQLVTNVYLPVPTAP